MGVILSTTLNSCKVHGYAPDNNLINSIVGVLSGCLAAYLFLLLFLLLYCIDDVYLITIYCNKLYWCF